MYPIVLVTGDDKVNAHYAEIRDGVLNEVVVSVVECFSRSPFSLPIYINSDDAWAICKIVSIVESTTMAVKCYGGSKVILICAEREKFDSKDVQMIYDCLYQYLVDVADIVFTVGECGIDSGVNIENATRTAVELIGMAVRGNGI